MSTQMTAKQLISEVSMDLLAEYTDVAHARLATLGGAGIEAEVWQTRNIPGSHAHLIERDAEKLRFLRRNYPDFLHWKELATFPSEFVKSYGPKLGLDYFHLDLCGTIEPEIHALTRILPLLMKGTGRVFRLTISDQRGNRALYESQLIQQTCEHVFGDTWPTLWTYLLDLRAHEEIVQETHATAENIALREAGALLYFLLALSGVQRSGTRYTSRVRNYPLSQFLSYRKNGGRHAALVELLSKGRVLVMPDRMERYVYLSDASRFRMRSFCFHLSVCAEPLSFSQAARQLAQLVLKTNCAVVQSGEIHRISLQRIVSQRRQALLPQTPAQCNIPKEIVMAESKEVEEIKTLFLPVLDVIQRPDLKDGLLRLCALATKQDDQRKNVVRLEAELDRRYEELPKLQALLGSAQEIVDLWATAPAKPSDQPFPPPVAARSKKHPAPAARTATSPKSPSKVPPSADPTLPAVPAHHQFDDILLELHTNLPRDTRQFQRSAEKMAKRMKIFSQPGWEKKIDFLVRASNGKRFVYFAARIYFKTPETERKAKLEELAQASHGVWLSAQLLKSMRNPFPKDGK